MAISNIDQLLAGMQESYAFFKAAGSNGVAGKHDTPWYRAGFPGAGVADTSTATGVARSSSSGLVAGQIPFYDPGGGLSTVLARFVGTYSQSAAAVYLLDRLWDCGAQSNGSAISPTSTSAQTINSTAWPARDANGSTNGVGVMIGLEVSSVMGAATPTATLTYTNSSNAGSRTATLEYATTSAAVAGSFFPFQLQAGDVGVRSIQSIQLGSSWLSGQLVLVAYRILQILAVPTASSTEPLDAISGGLVPLYNGTVFQVLGIGSAAAAPTYFGSVRVAQG